LHGQSRAEEQLGNVGFFVFKREDHRQARQLASGPIARIENLDHGRPPCGLNRGRTISPPCRSCQQRSGLSTTDKSAPVGDLERGCSLDNRKWETNERLNSRGVGWTRGFERPKQPLTRGTLIESRGFSRPTPNWRRYAPRAAIRT